MTPIFEMISSGMGVGSNPTAWLVVVAFFLVLARYGLDLRKETPMKTTKLNRKAQVKSRPMSVLTAVAETCWAIMTSIVAGLVTHSIHAKGAPREG